MDIALAHGRKKIYAASDVVLEVELGLTHGLADKGVCGEVHDGIGLLGHHCGSDSCGVAQVADMERHALGDGFAVAAL